MPKPSARVPIRWNLRSRKFLLRPVDNVNRPRTRGVRTKDPHELLDEHPTDLIVVKILEPHRRGESKDCSSAPGIRSTMVMELSKRAAIADRRPREILGTPERFVIYRNRFDHLAHPYRSHCRSLLHIIRKTRREIDR